MGELTDRLPTTATPTGFDAWIRKTSEVVDAAAPGAVWSETQPDDGEVWIDPSDPDDAGTGTSVHGELTGRHAENSHPQVAITGLTTALDAKAAGNDARFPAGADIVDTDIGAAAAIAPTKIAGTAVVDADARLTDQRVPTDGSVTNAKVASDAAIALSKLATDPLARSGHTGVQAQSTVTDLTTDLAALTAADKAITANVQAAAYTLVLADAGKAIEMNVGSANNLTVPPNSSVAFPVGTVVEVCQVGAGATTVVAGSGVTIRTPETLVMSGQWSSVSLRKRGTDEWVLAGDVEAA